MATPFIKANDEVLAVPGVYVPIATQISSPEVAAERADWRPV